MTAERRGFVHEAVLRLVDGVDPAEVGAAVTVALCGHWEHEGGCRWPHNNESRGDAEAVSFRMVFVAPPAEADEVHDRIERALQAATGWTVTSGGRRPVRNDERALAARPAATPPPTQ